MIKECVVCSEKFHTKDSRQKNCSQTCANISRSLWNKVYKEETQQQPPVAVRDLPPPEDLPAPYAKRVYDMWRKLIEDTDVRTRIA